MSSYSIYHINDLKSEEGSYRLERYNYRNTYILRKDFTNTDEYYYLLKIKGEPKFAMLSRSEGDIYLAKERADEFLNNQK